MRKIIGFGMLGIFGVIFFGFSYMLIPDWRIHAAILGTISLLPAGVYFVISGSAKSLPNSGDGPVSRNPTNAPGLPNGDVRFVSRDSEFDAKELA